MGEDADFCNTGHETSSGVSDFSEYLCTFYVNTLNKKNIYIRVVTWGRLLCWRRLLREVAERQRVLCGEALERSV